MLQMSWQQVSTSGMEEVNPRHKKTSTSWGPRADQSFLVDHISIKDLTPERPEQGMRTTLDKTACVPNRKSCEFSFLTQKGICSSFATYDEHVSS